MGMDSVELVMEVEDQFKVKLPDFECGQVHTVADLAAIVITHLPKNAVFCPTARSFFDLRNLITKHTGIAHRTIRPRTRLESLFPAAGRKRLWAKIQSYQAGLPPLTASERVISILNRFTGFLIFLFVIGTGVAWGFGGVAVLWLAGCVLIAGIILSQWTNSLFATQFPPGCETIGDLSRLITMVRFPSEGGQKLIAQAGILEEVRLIVSEQLGLPLDEVQPESDFVKDLNC